MGKSQTITLKVDKMFALTLKYFEKISITFLLQ